LTIIVINATQHVAYLYLFWYVCKQLSFSQVKLLKKVLEYVFDTRKLYSPAINCFSHATTVAYVCYQHCIVGTSSRPLYTGKKRTNSILGITLTKFDTFS